MDGNIHTDSLKITPEVLTLIAEIDEFKGAWLAVGRISHERLNALHRVATIESVGSSTRIEGARLTDKEVENLLADPDVRNLKSRDDKEVAGYAETMKIVFDHWRDIDLTEDRIRQLHRDLLQYSSTNKRHLGEYKNQFNHIEAFGPDGLSLGIVSRTARPFDTPRLMAELVGWTCAAMEEAFWHPLITIAVFLVVFLEIHPFQDGNGRLSRILTTLLLLRAGYAYVPYSSHERVIERNRDAYYASLRQSQRGIRTHAPDWAPWLTFFLRSLQQQKARLEKRLERDRRLHGHGDLPVLSAQILRLCRERGRVTVAGAVAATGANRNTIKDHLKALKRARHIEQHGAGRGTWYGLS